MTEGNGTQFDPEVFEAFLAVEDEVRTIIERWSETKKNSKSSTTGIMTAVRSMVASSPSGAMEGSGTDDQAELGDAGGAGRTQTVALKTGDVDAYAVEDELPTDENGSI